MESTQPRYDYLLELLSNVPPSFREGVATELIVRIGHSYGDHFGETTLPHAAERSPFILLCEDHMAPDFWPIAENMNALPPIQIVALLNDFLFEIDEDAPVFGKEALAALEAKGPENKLETEIEQSVVALSKKLYRLDFDEWQRLISDFNDLVNMEETWDDVLKSDAFTSALNKIDGAVRDLEAKGKLKDSREHRLFD